MKLVNVRIQNYKSIEDSGEFSVRQLNCLVGKNESGKTVSLLGLYKLNPIYPSPFDVTPDFPRNKLTTYQQKIRRGESHDNVITTVWELSDAEYNTLKDAFGIDILRSRNVKITRGYSNELEWSIEIDHLKIVAHLLRTSPSLDQNDWILGISRLQAT